MQQSIPKTVIYPYRLNTESDNLITANNANNQNKREYPQKPSVLIVEDDFTSQRVAKLMVESFGYQATIVSTGELALKNYYKHDLILLDHGLPDIDGVTVCKQIRAQEKGKTIPIIALTANCTLQEECLAVGMNAYAIKPIELKVLKEILTAYIRPE
jgi:CheY-like chemotaxis protein